MPDKVPTKCCCEFKHSFTCNVSAAPAPTPQNLRFSQITHTSARVHWSVGDFPMTDVDHFIVSYVPADGSGKRIVIRVRGKIQTNIECLNINGQNVVE